ncbi:glycosyltransferase [Flagellimonas meridianipacifica]|uniref:Glycosyltransferase involved in cell wall biosynthesis n=1 Tax=Flagellimonas meridianipacifica TaxID=1080225 RepID=A0A2T0MCR9_9FLAO|nr:glycosyltransferase [Allomuricauda pacifica]PRX55297.1 glycosyltransferase involved in cell wall biosynthesis [Allomuricauda pacifica]
MNILVISNNYPSSKYPSRGVFVYNLIQHFCGLGHKVTVISPETFSMTGLFKKKKSYGVEKCTVYRPKFLSLSSIQLGSFNTYRIAELGQIKGIRKIIDKNNLEFDLVYTHFMMNGIIAANAVNKYKKPIFCAIGESDLLSFAKRYSETYFKESIGRLKGFIAVSNKLKGQLIDFGVSENKIFMKPNAVDLTKFYKRNKEEMRNKYNLPTNLKLIAFVGRFMEHKGPLRVLEAAKDLKDVGILFIGSGPQEPQGPSVVFKGSVPSFQIPELLSSADLFVLPTQKEGSCNAIAEAIACGLPIVSSDIPEVRDQCDPSFSILVDPMDVEALKHAIGSIIEDEQRSEEMSKKALETSKDFEIGERASSILGFISKTIKS